MNDSENSSGSAFTARILRASVAIAVAHLLFKVLGLIQYKVIGYACDSVTRDLFAYGFEGVLGTLFFIGEEALGPAFLPLFMGARNKDGEEVAWNLARTVLFCQIVLISIAVAVVLFAPEFIVIHGTRWAEKGKNPRFMEFAPLYAQYFVAGLFCLSLGSTTYMILNGYKRFFLAALGDAVMKLCLVIALGGAFFWLRAKSPTGTSAPIRLEGYTALYVFAGGIIVGSVGKLLTHLFGLRDLWTRFRGSVDFRSPAFRHFLLLMAPLLCGILFAKTRDYFNQQYVLSNVEAGMLSSSAWSRKIFQALGFIVPYAVSIAMLPFFCELVDRDKKDELGAMITRSSRLVLLIAMPLAALVIALSLPITQILYQGGQFTYQDCLLVATSNQCYSLVLPTMTVEYVLMQAFFANRKMISVTLIGMIFSALSMWISYYCIFILEWRGVFALGAVAMAMVISKTLKAGSLALVMRRFLPCFPLGESLSFLIRLSGVSGAAGIAAWQVRGIYEASVAVQNLQDTKDILLWVGLDLAVSGLVGVAVALLSAWFLCRGDLILTLNWARKKLNKADKRR